jgi:hypothetical protein
LPICTDQRNDRQKLARIHYYWHGSDAKLSSLVQKKVNF